MTAPDPQLEALSPPPRPPASPAPRPDVPAHPPHRIAARLLLVSIPAGIVTTLSLIIAVIAISSALDERLPDLLSELPRIGAGMLAIFTGGSLVLVLTDELARHVRRALRLPIVLAGIVLLPLLVAAGSVWVEALTRGLDPYVALGRMLDELPGAVRDTGTFFAMFLLPFGFVLASRSGALPIVGALGPLREALVWSVIAPLTFTLAAAMDRDHLPPDTVVRTVGVGLALVAAPLGLALGDRLDARALVAWRRWRDAGT